MTHLKTLHVRAAAFWALASVSILAAACGSDNPAATSTSSAAQPTAAPTAEPSPTALPTATATPAGVPFMVTAPDIPAGSPTPAPTAGPGVMPDYVRRSDSFPVEGERPYVELVTFGLQLKPEGSTALEHTVSLVPSAAAVSDFQDLTIANVALWEQQNGWEPLTYADGESAWEDRLLDLLHSSDVFKLPPMPTEGGWLSGFISAHIDQTNTFDSLGIDQRNVEQAAQFHGGQSTVEITMGRYDPELSLSLLEQCDCPQPEFREYHGETYMAWEDGGMQMQGQPPVFDMFGRGGYVWLTEDGIQRAFTEDAMHALIDTAMGDAPSALETVDGLKEVVRAMAALDANNIQVWSGDRFDFDTQLGDHEGAVAGSGVNGVQYTVTADSQRANALMAPLLADYTLFGTGYQWDGEQQVTVAAFYNKDEETALLNRDRLASRIVNSNTDSGLPWGTQIERAEFAVQGRLLVMRLFARPHEGTPHLFPVDLFANGSLLILHE